ncbi:MAG: SpoIIE family protein phosphatase, partial [Leptospiraceae bacterium]|nr:SpoIIE family protein phosphatase [Leptospiraceae bacterium]
PGELFFAFSDVYSESQYRNFNEFGDDALIEIIKGNFDAPLEQIAEKINQAVYEFEDGQPAHDDKTLLMFRKL